MTLILWILIGLTALSLLLNIIQWSQHQHTNIQLKHILSHQETKSSENTQQMLTFNNQLLGKQMEGFKILQESLHKGMHESREQIASQLKQSSQQMMQQIQQLTQTTDNRLKEISGNVEKRLSDGFEKTTETFANVIKRLALIDEAQKKITELSGNVVSLQEILSDKRSRGAFGEVQLSSLIRNVMPESNFSLQHTLSNGKRVDCFLYLPEPTGNLAIDAKFPLETYQQLTRVDLSESDKRQFEQQFRQDIKVHINAIAEKYIIPNETSDGAIMFIPAEAVFSEIHAHFPDLVGFAQKQKVWMVSPTTMMAILTTARAVIKDVDTRKHVNIIQEHLGHLAKDFGRFEKRMDALATHIAQANRDVESVHTSAKKITGRFSKIEQIELDSVVADVMIEE
jgi:DNA recombination protein RmuC